MVELRFKKLVRTPHKEVLSVAKKMGYIIHCGLTSLGGGRS